MNRVKCVAFLLLGCFTPAHAFTTVDEQIDHYLEVFFTGEQNAKITMLKRLQWSGISDPRLFNSFEYEVERKGMKSNNKLNKGERDLVAHQIRALGYSGNARYRWVLERVSKKSKNTNFRNHAKKALLQLDKFNYWHQLIADSEFSIEGKSVEITTYMKMLSTDHFMVQRLAARAMFHERRQDVDLLALSAEKLERLYLQPGLDGEAQDTVAWLCKAIGENGNREYGELLQRVVKDTPYRKVRNHAKKYIE
jgi:hypothetical protein